MPTSLHHRAVVPARFFPLEKRCQVSARNAATVYERPFGSVGEEDTNDDEDGDDKEKTGDELDDGV